MCDQISDARARRDPAATTRLARVACETATHHRPGPRDRRDHDHDLRRHPDDRARDGPRDRLHRRALRLRLPTPAASSSRIKEQSPRHRHGRRARRSRAKHGAGGSTRRARRHRRRRPGHDDRLRLQRDAGAHAAADRAGAQALPRSLAARRARTADRCRTCAPTARAR